MPWKADKENILIFFKSFLTERLLLLWLSNEINNYVKFKLNVFNHNSSYKRDMEIGEEEIYLKLLECNLINLILPYTPLVSIVSNKFELLLLSGGVWNI